MIRISYYDMSNTSLTNISKKKTSSLLKTSKQSMIKKEQRNILQAIGQKNYNKTKIQMKWT